MNTLRCELCDGTGTIATPGRPWFAFWQYVPCPACDGHGTEKEPPPHVLEKKAALLPPLPPPLPAPLPVLAPPVKRGIGPVEKTTKVKPRHKRKRK